jgi:hypothetical protein
MRPRTGALVPDSRPDPRHGGRHGQPKTMDQGVAALAMAGMKLAAAGRLGTAALAVPAANAWASPGSISLTHLNPHASTARDLTGPGAQFRIFKYAKPPQAASGGQSRRSPASGRAGSARPLVQPAQQQVPGQEQPGGHSAVTTLADVTTTSPSARNAASSADPLISGGSTSGTVVSPTGNFTSPVNPPVGTATNGAPARWTPAAQQTGTVTGDQCRSDVRGLIAPVRKPARQPRCAISTASKYKEI